MEAPMPIRVAWVNRGLRKYLEQDEYGVYKKEGVIIPWFYRRKYNKFKKLREEQIENAFNIAHFTYPDKIDKD